MSGFVFGRYKHLNGFGKKDCRADKAGVFSEVLYSFLFLPVFDVFDDVGPVDAFAEDIFVVDIDVGADFPGVSSVPCAACG